MPRPDAPTRPVCRYYNTTPRGCFEGAKCRYLHGDPAVQKYAPYEEEKRCRFFDAGYCKRGKACWFRHVDPQHASRERDGDKDNERNDAGTLITPLTGSEEENEEDMLCGICLEKPALYGLLSGCSHAFCLTCIRRWRDPEEKDADMTHAGIHKTCPMCRLRTKFIIPSSLFYPQDDPRKAGVVEMYKQSMARVPCRYFVKSKPGKRFCPFGRDCFYQHANLDGTRYEFSEGVDVMMMQWHRRRNNTHSASHHPDPIQAALEVLEGFAETLAADDGTDDSGTRRAIIDMHVRDMLRIMGAAPALRTLAQLERMAGPDPDEPEASTSSQQEQTAEEPESVAVELASVEPDVFGSMTPTATPASPLMTPTVQDTASSISPMSFSSPSSVSPLSSSSPSYSSPLSPSSPSSSSSSLFSLSSSVADPDSSYESQDPRLPQNASRANQLMSGDFAWMMEERHGTSDVQEGCSP